MRDRSTIDLLVAACILLSGIAARGAVFPTGEDENARLEVEDATGGLSWNPPSITPAPDSLTVTCWAKISIPDGVNLSTNMTILADRKSGSWTDPFSYRLYLNIMTGNIEFEARGTTAKLSPIVLVERPYLDRWYHLAVVRSGNSYFPYVDGRGRPAVAQDIGSTSNTNGISIGGFKATTNGTERFWGEIQEVAIYHQALSRAQLVYNMYNDVPPASFPNLKGYFKLAYSEDASDHLKNFAAAPPTGTVYAVKVDDGEITFPESDTQGEQSLFDSRKNQGGDAAGVLSGAFVWNRQILSRPTAGVAFGLSIGYCSANAVVGIPLEGGVNVFGEDAVLGPGWMHSLQTRLVPGDLFLQGSSSYLGLITWDGGFETWKREAGGVYWPQHGEYRGEMNTVDGGDSIEWVTPDRTVYKFHHQSNALEPLLAGKLAEIHDFDGNRIVLQYDPALGRLTSAADTGGGVWEFSYNPQGLLTTIVGPSTNVAQRWTVTFSYDGSNRLEKQSLTGPATYEAPWSTEWRFEYYDSGDSENMLKRIWTPRNHDLDVAYDKYGRKTSETSFQDGRTTYTYNAPGMRQLTSTRRAAGSGDSPNDRVTVETFDRKLRLTETTDPMGYVTKHEYDSAGNVTAITDGQGNRTTMTYDDRANMLSRTDPLGHTTQWEYGHVLDGGISANRPTKETDPLGWETDYTYDPAGNLLSRADALGVLESHAYDARGLETTAWNANSNATRFVHNDVTGFLLSRTVVFGTSQAVTWSNTVSELGWVLEELDPLGRRTTKTYNVNGQAVSVTDPILRVFTKTYDATGNLTAESDGKGTLTTYGYDGADQKTWMKDRSGNQWDYSYNNFRELVSTKAPAVVSDGASHRNTATREYDKNGRVVRELDPYGRGTTHEYDANGNEVAVVDRLGNRWEKQYDAAGRAIAERDPEGNVKRTIYDDAGRVGIQISPNGDRSTHEYDGRGRLTRWIDPEGYEWVYTYDGNGNILDVEDALGGHYVMTYGPRNERLTERNQDLDEWIYTYDALARLATQADPNGTTRTLTYDTAGRLHYVEFNTGRVNTLGYDNNDNVTSVGRTGAGQPPTSLYLDYDEVDHLYESRDTFSMTVGYRYDAIGRITEKIYPGAKPLRHEYDRVGDLKALRFDYSASQTFSCAFTYDEADRLVGRTYPNGVAQTNVFDAAGRLTSMAYQKDTNSLVALTYAYDRNGNKIAGTEQGTLDWRPEDVSDYDETTSFTAAGKMIERINAAPETPKVFTYEYDDSGNMIRASTPGESYDLTYDEDNRTTSIVWDTGLASKLVQNRYDGLGKRVSRTVDGDETRYVLDLGEQMEWPLCEFGISGTPLFYYVHANDLCYRIDAATGEATTFHADASANVLAVADSNGDVTEQYAYTPYGRLVSSFGASSSPYRFVGALGVVEDLPGLHFMRARYYCANAGRFLAVDPEKSIGPSKPLVFYHYSRGNPLAQVDPDGRLEFLGNLIFNRAARDVEGMSPNAAAEYWKAWSGGVGETQQLVKNIKKGTDVAAFAVHTAMGNPVGMASSASSLVGDRVTETGHESAGNYIKLAGSVLGILGGKDPTDLKESFLVLNGILGFGSIVNDLSLEEENDENRPSDLKRKSYQAVNKALVTNSEQASRGGKRVSPKSNGSSSDSPGSGGINWGGVNDALRDMKNKGYISKQTYYKVKRIIRRIRRKSRNR